VALDRMTLFEKVQLGLETTRGVLVPANKLMTAMSIMVSPQTEIQRFAPAGIKFMTQSVLNKEWSRARVEGIPTYNEIVYALASIMGKTTPTGGPAYTWTFEMDYAAPDDPATYTIEQGVAPNAMKAGYGLFTSFSIVAARGENSLAGEMMAQVVEDGITPTASPTSIALKPIIAKSWDLYADDTSGGLGGTRLGRAFRTEFRINDRYRMVWPLRSDQASYASHAEVRPTVEMMVRIEADDDAVELVRALKEGDSKYMRLVATSGTDYITGTTPYKFQTDFNGIVVAAGDLGDEDGVVTREFTLAAKLDTGWGSGRALQVQVVNDIGSL